MVINMDESGLRTIEQIKQFFSGSALVAYSKNGERGNGVTR